MPDDAAFRRRFANEMADYALDNRRSALPGLSRDERPSAVDRARHGFRHIERFRRVFPKQRPVVVREASEFDEAVLHGDLADGGGGRGVAFPERGVDRAEPLAAEESDRPQTHRISALCGAREARRSGPVEALTGGQHRYGGDIYRGREADPHHPQGLLRQIAILNYVNPF
jgi:hypothetical protein